MKCRKSCGGCIRHSFRTWIRRCLLELHLESQSTRRDFCFMNILALGRGKTGSLVAEVARECGHQVTVMGAADNPKASALTAANLAQIDLVIDFTLPGVVLENIEACVR